MRKAKKLATNGEVFEWPKCQGATRRGYAS